MAGQSDQSWWDNIPETRGGPTLKERQGEMGIVQSGASAGSLAAGARRSDTLLPVDVRKTGLEADRLAAENAAKDKEAKAAEKAAGLKINNLRDDANNTLRKIRDARRMVSRWSTGLPGQLLSNLGGTEANNLRAQLASIGSDTMLGSMAKLKEESATGSTGLGQIAVFEAKALRDKIGSLDQTVDADQLLASLAAIERHFRRSYAVSNQQNPDDPEVAKEYGIVMGNDEPPSDKDLPPPPGAELTGTTDIESPAELRGLNSTVATMLKQGIPAGEIRAYLNNVQPTLGDRVDKNLEWYENYYRQNPDGPLEPRLDLERNFKPKEGLARTVGEIAESPIGAGVIGAADTITGGFLDEMTANPELSRAVMSSVQEENPGAYLTGQVLGGVGGTAGVGGLGMLGAKYGLPTLGAKGLAALEGGVYGAGSADSDSFVDRGLGAARGAALGYGGQKVLGAATRGIANAVGGVKNTPAALLDKYGVPLTIGEILGGKIAGIEQKLGRAAIIGAPVRARHEEGLEGFNKAAFDYALAPIGETTEGVLAEKGIQAAKRKLGSFYDNLLGGKQITPDATFTAEKDAILNDIITNIPNYGETVVRHLNNRVGDFFDPAKVMTGTEWQAALRGIRGVSQDFKTNDVAAPIRDQLGRLETAFSDLAARQHPDIVPGLEKANEAWRKYSILKDAVRGSMETGGGLTTPEFLLRKGAENAERYGTRGASAEGTYPFFDLSQAGIDVMTPVRKRNLDSPFALSTGLGLSGATLAHYLQGNKSEKTGEIEGRNLGLTALAGIGAASLTAPYSKSAQKGLQKLLMRYANPGAKKAGDFLRDKASKVVGGGTTAPLTDLLLNSDLPRTDYDEFSDTVVSLPPPTGVDLGELMRRYGRPQE